jgi:hypothetical protein
MYEKTTSTPKFILKNHCLKCAASSLMVPVPGSRARVRSEQVRHSLEFVRLDRSVAVQIEHLESDPEMPESISQFPVLSLYRVRGLYIGKYPPPPPPPGGGGE